ncbi:MAG TPA: hypothetical protein VH639_04950 [Bryobacteraceae bacterium]|jgi:hypothetical protein
MRGTTVRRLIGPFAIVAAAVAAWFLATAPIAAQAPPTARKGPPAPQGPTPRLANGRADFSGLWRPGDIYLIEDISLGLKPGETVPLNDWGKEEMKNHLSKNDPEANCLPTGVPRHAPYPWKIVETPPYIYFLFEGNIHSYRQIFMDGRTHPKDPNPTWYGHSVGHWEGDTLVVDTVGFNDKFWFDFVGHPHTEQLHTIERYTRKDLGTLLEEVTIEDPGAYTRPFTVNASHRLLPGDELMEYICQENQRDTQHIVGPAGRP